MLFPNRPRIRAFDEGALDSYVYQERRPFHPARIGAAFAAKWPGVVQVKGRFWIASNPDLIGKWFQTEHGSTLSPGGRWWAAIPRAEWPVHQAPAIEAVWQEPYGDRRQEFFIIGQKLDRAEIVARFARALLTPAEEALGEARWREFDEPAFA